MRDTLWKRCELIQKLGGLPEPKVENREWLYLFSEESRNSIAIEGLFVSEKEFKDIVLRGSKPRSRSEEEAYNYYRTALYFYGLA
ncbi:MAG: hypothetical protein NZM36_02765 [Aquificaceae bacterium]|nr:hypothetical protein [Aquificaceae bacterium]